MTRRDRAEVVITVAMLTAVAVSLWMIVASTH